MGIRVSNSHVTVEVVIVKFLGRLFVGILGLSCSVWTLLDAKMYAGIAEITVTRLGEVHPLHDDDHGRGVFADVMLLGNDRVITTYQLAGMDSFCEGKSLYFQEFKRDLSPVESERQIIDVNAEGSI